MNRRESLRAVAAVLPFSLCTSKALPASPASAPEASGGRASAPAGTKQVISGIVQHLTWDSPYTQSIEKYYYLNEPPSLRRFATILAAEVDARNRFKDKVDIRIERSTDTRFRAVISKARSIVITGKPYWEFIHIDASLTETHFQSLAHASGLNVSPDYSPRLRTSDLDRVMQVMVPVYDFTIVVSGRFKAGGEPASSKDYTDDMEAHGFSSELESLASKVMERQLSGSNQETVDRFNMSTGNSVGRTLEGRP